MTVLPYPADLLALKSLNLSHLAVQPVSNGLIAYFDFEKMIVFPSKQKNDFEYFSQFTKDHSNLSFSGWIGFFGYELLAFNLGLSLSANRDLEVPDGWFGRPDSLIKFFPRSTHVESTEPRREKEISALLTKANSSRIPSPQTVAREISCNLDYKQYEDTFHSAREAILDGETYQIKISQRFEAEARLDPLTAFRKLNFSNPSPEAFLLLTPEFSLVSCSPETVIDKKGRNLSTRPIGGTYQRTHSSLDDSVIERFLGDPKEVAEHNMLVDLERNDLSTICKQGSVRIERFREVESYAHLHHLVSTISGELRAQTGLGEIARAMLPGGSITGCPKIRTMEWIDRLEPCFRGPYTGSFGVISDDGDLRFNIIIRAMLIINGKCYTQAGGGIVVDSTPRYEFKENKIKAQALLDLLQ